MITPQDVELIAMVLQRAPILPIEAEWLNWKLDELRILVKGYVASQQISESAKASVAEERAGSARQD